VAEGRNFAHMTERDAYDELCAYTLSHQSSDFIHQHVVDVFAAQRASPSTKPITLAFALVGLCLQLEHGFSGREVQRAHRTLASRSKNWPSFPLPIERGSITAVEVLAAPPGPARDAAIQNWCAAVWNAYAEQAPAVRVLVAEHRMGNPPWGQKL
jgi:hypothetical protein